MNANTPGTMLFIGLQRSYEIRQMQRISFAIFSRSLEKSNTYATCSKYLLSEAIIIIILCVQGNCSHFIRWQRVISDDITTVFRWSFERRTIFGCLQRHTHLNPAYMGWTWTVQTFTVQTYTYIHTDDKRTAPNVVLGYDETSNSATLREINNEFDWRKR